MLLNTMQLNDSNIKTLEKFSFSNFNCAHFERMTGYAVYNITFLFDKDGALG